jgi:hypothetical protein
MAFQTTLSGHAWSQSQLSESCNPEEATARTALSGNGHNYQIISAFGGRVVIMSDFDTKTFNVRDDFLPITPTVSS